MGGLSARDARRIFLAQLPLIDGIVRTACRRRRLSPESSEEFRSEVMIKLIDDDYAVLRRFQGGSSLSTYLTVVVRRLLLDRQIREWGRWRNSERAKRLGSTAMRLEQLMSRDELTTDEAVETLALDESENATRDALRALAQEIPLRRKRPRTSALEFEPESSRRPADHLVERRDRESLGHRASDCLAKALSDLDPEDVQLLELCFHEGLSVASISRRLGVNQAKLYRRFDKILKVLRRSFDEAGIDRASALSLIGHARAFASNLLPAERARDVRLRGQELERGGNTLPTSRGTGRSRRRSPSIRRSGDLRPPSRVRLL